MTNVLLFLLLLVDLATAIAVVILHYQNKSVNEFLRERRPISKRRAASIWIVDDVPKFPPPTVPKPDIKLYDDEQEKSG